MTKSDARIWALITGEAQVYIVREPTGTDGTFPLPDED